MKMTVQFFDGSWLLGERRWWFHKSKGTHYFIVLDGSNAELKQLIGKKLAIPINSAKYFILDADKGLKK